MQPGDAVIINAANGTVGSLLVQLCAVLRLRAVAVVSGEGGSFDKTSAWLKSLGAAEVLLDAGSLKASVPSVPPPGTATLTSPLAPPLAPPPPTHPPTPHHHHRTCTPPSLQAELNKAKFFARPKLALDAVGGASAARLADALQQQEGGGGGQLVVYGALSGKSPPFSWHQWVFQGLSVRGFNARRWMADNRKRLPAVLDSLAKLVAAGKLRAEVTE